MNRTRNTASSSSRTSPNRRRGAHRSTLNEVSATDALDSLRSGMRVFIGSGCAAPENLIAALADRAGDVYDVEVCHHLMFADAPYASRDMLDRFRHNALYIGRNVRPSVHEGVADYTPVNLCEVPALFRQRPFDLALIQVSEPDADGWCSLGVSVDVVKAAVENATRVVAEVNRHMPRTCGEARVHVSRLNAIVRNDRPLIQLPPPEMTPEFQKIGEWVASLIDNGSTLRIGIGDIPSAVLNSLLDKKDLGFHGEILTDSVLPLIEKGVLTGSNKSLLPLKVVASSCLGGKALFDYIDDNGDFEFRGTDFTCDPFVIAQNRRMVSIGTAIEVDLTGQICGESVGEKFYSGFGAQLDFMRGAARSEGGKSIIALRSTTPHERASRIAPLLRAGTGVMATRADVQYVVTEYGIASLHGKSIRERALALISIAHPKFREELMRQAREHKWVHPHQISFPRNVQPYPKHYENTARFRRKEIFFRPILPTDEGLLKELFYSHSERTILNRFFTPLRRLTPDLVQRFVTLDYKNDMAIVGLAELDGRQRMVCVGRYFRDRTSNDAEVAFTVHDDFQGFGLGRFLMKTLIRIARESGIAGFSADVRLGNKPMLKLMRASARKLEKQKHKGFYHLRFGLADAV